MKTLVLFFLVLTVTTSAFAQAPVRKFYANPSDQAAADKEAAQERAYQERSAIANAKVTNIKLSNGAVCKVAIISVRADGLILRDASDTPRMLAPELLGIEDRVRFGYGTPEEQAAVAKINAERETARLAAEQLELQRRQAEAQEAIADELHRQETNRLIFGR